MSIAAASAVARSARMWKPAACLTKPDPNAASGAAQAQREVTGALGFDPRRTWHRCGQQRRAADQAEVPAQTQQEQADEDHRGHVTGDDRRDRARAEHDGTHLDRPHRADAIDETAHERGEPEHPEDVHCDHDRRQVGLTVILHVRRRHRHDAHHRRLRAGHRDDPQHRTGRRPDDAVRATNLPDRSGAIGVRIGAAHQHQRVGAQHDRVHHRPEHEERAGEQVRADELVEAEQLAEVLLERGEHRSEDGAERADPDDRTDRTGPVVFVCEIGRDVAGLQRGGLTRAEEEHAEDEEGEPSQLTTGRCDRGPDATGQQRQRSSRAGDRGDACMRRVESTRSRRPT